MAFENPFSSSAEAEQEEAREGRKTYDTEMGPVEVTWERFDASAHNAEHKKEQLAKAVLFLPGWAMTAESKSIQPLSQSFADYADAPVYELFTFANKVPESDMLHSEAEAIRKFIEENGLNEIVITGHSQGGDKSIDLVTLLQEKNPEINVKGLVLMDSVGLHGQGEGELAAKFAKDSMIDTPTSVAKKVLGFGKYFKGEKSFYRSRSWLARMLFSESLRK